MQELENLPFKLIIKNFLIINTFFDNLSTLYLK